MTRRNTLVTTLLGLGFLGAGLALWAWPSPLETPSEAPSHKVVRAAEATRLTTSRAVRLSGVTRAAQRAALSFAVPARLVSRPVQVGDHVTAGQVVAALDNREFANALASARAVLSELEVRLSQAKRDRLRVDRLVAARAATAEEQELTSAAAASIRAAHQAAEAQLADARRLLDEATLRAPFAGTVTAVLLEPGEWASPGNPVILLSGDGATELQVEVPESTVSSLAIGDEVLVELPFLGGAPVAGRISSVAGAAAGPGRLFPVVVSLDAAPGVTAGMTAELLLHLDADDALTVPLAAVLNPGSSEPSVFCIRDGHARRTPVRPAHLAGDRVVVHGALQAGDAVIVAGHTRLADGDPVEVTS